MDLSLLPHLSERALREEAERRGVDVDGLGRDAIIAAIRTHEGRALTTAPPSPPSQPSQPAEASPLRAARSLLGRVLDLARSALEGKSEPPGPVEAPETVPEEPIRTRSMARLLEQQGHVARALPIVRELRTVHPADEELLRWEERLRRAVAERSLEASAAEGPAGCWLRFVDVDGQRGAVWRVDEVGMERARALLGTSGALTLRAVRVLRHPDRSVESRLSDHRPVEPSGWALLEAPPTARLVVAVGLGDDERFVSIAHAAS